ncbi:HYR domain-containing protein, partial [Algoriphagus kandeliae]
LVNYTATDIHGNSETASFTVTVTDNELPVITNVPANITVNTDPGVCEAVVSWAEPQVADNCGIESFAADQANGSTFPVGTTTVTYTATDIHGNTETASFTVTVTDTQAPVITTNGDQNLDAEAGLCEATVEVTANATDNCSVGEPTGVRSDGLAISDPYPVGVTTILWNVADVNGNSAAEVTQTITVTDTQAPVITTNGDQNIDAEAGLCEATVEVTANATDNCSVGEPIGVRSDDQALTDPYPVGVTTITWSVTDINGNPATEVTQTISVTDTQAPVITCPSDISTTVEFGVTGKIITYDSPVATDNCGISSVELIEGFASGTEFPLGETIVTYRVTDVSGNSAECSFTVSIAESEDNIDPIIDGCPTSISVSNDPGICEATVSWSQPFATDNSGVVNLTSNFEPGSVFPIGTTRVTYTATDAAGNQATCSFDVTVTDDETPVVLTRNRVFAIDSDQTLILSPLDVDDGSTDNCGILSYQLSQTDFTLADEGENIVTLTITDENGNQGSATAIVTISINAIDPGDLDSDNDGFTPNQGDCDDSDDTVYPGAPEVCDGKDNNCDGAIDEGVQTAFYIDADGDGYGDVNAEAVFACAAPEGYVTDNSDCDDFDDTVYPGAPEVCDGKDNNCDGTIDEGVRTAFYIDGDGDGFGDVNAEAVFACAAPEGYVTDNSDCDDLDDTVYPGAPEVCDGKDNNCDGTIDEGVQTAFYMDSDGDGFGDANSEAVFACIAPEGFVTDNSDCDDSDDTVYPGAPELCDGKDNDCDGTIDEDVQTAFYIDSDGDGFGDVNGEPVFACDAPEGYVADNSDCYDSDKTIYPGAPELCDGKDNNCDGAIDEGVQSAFYIDADGDGYGSENAQPEYFCLAPIGYADNNLDCDDQDPNKNPGAPESCSDNPCLDVSPVTSISGPLDPIQINNPVQVNASISGEIVEAKWVWDNGDETILTAPFEDFAAEYTYSQTGVYQIQLVLVDVCGNEWTALTDLAVIFDPNGGFITGGGWIWSPKGAYLNDTDLEGRANFGFVAKYRKGSNRVDGNTEFQFKNGDLNFNSSSHEDMSLVIAGAKGIYKGTGKINGVEGYSFMVSAIDGALKESTESDKFRIKIWETISGNTVYDNQLGSSDFADASTEISGGNIVIHMPAKGKNKSIDSNSLVTVDWNTPFEELKTYTWSIDTGEELLEMEVDWDQAMYDPLTPGLQPIEGQIKSTIYSSRFLTDRVVMNVLVLDKPKALDITISEDFISKASSEGDVIGILSTVDPVDSIHLYSMEPHPSFELDGDRVIWKGSQEKVQEYVLKVSSLDRAGQAINREITLRREFGANEVILYPNPAYEETNLKVDLAYGDQVTIRVFDATGKLVLEESSLREKSFVQKLDLKGLSPGMYQVQVQIGFEVITKRLIKNQ